MVMSPTNGNDDSSLQRMINRARRAAGFTPHEEELIEAIHNPPDKAGMVPAPGPTSEEPPEEFVAILRMPAGGQHPVTVHIDDEDIQLVLNARGEDNPEREAYLWRWLLKRVRQEAR